MWLAFTKSTGGRIAATVFMNEPTYAAMGGAPKGYNTADFDRDIVVFFVLWRSTKAGTCRLRARGHDRLQRVKIMFGAAAKLSLAALARLHAFRCAV